MRSSSLETYSSRTFTLMLNPLSKSWIPLSCGICSCWLNSLDKQEEEAKRIFCQLMDGVEFCHMNNIFHRCAEKSLLHWAFTPAAIISQKDSLCNAVRNMEVNAGFASKIEDLG